MRRGKEWRETRRFNGQSPSLNTVNTRDYIIFLVKHFDVKCVNESVKWINVQ